MTQDCERCKRLAAIAVAAFFAGFALAYAAFSIAGYIATAA